MREKSYKTIKGKLKSLEYRLRLSQTIPELEQEIIEICKEYDSWVLCGYKIALEEGKVVLDKLPETSANQLEIDFEKKATLEEKVDSYYTGKYHGYLVDLKLVWKGRKYKPVYIRSPEDVYNFLKALQNESREKLVNIALDSKRKATGVDELSKGTVDSTITSPFEIFKFIFLHNAPSFILAHNHPSGDPTPSKEDVKLTQRVEKLSKLLEVDFLDHVIIGEDAYVSLKEKGVI